MAEKRHGVPCYDKAADNEPLFVLRAQDALAPMVVEYWAELAAKMKDPSRRYLRHSDARRP